MHTFKDSIGWAPIEALEGEGPQHFLRILIDFPEAEKQQKNVKLEIIKS